SATDRSMAGAQRRLAKRLSTEADLVPCPKCHWINSDLVKGYRRGVWPYVGMPIYILLVTGVLFLIMSTDVGESARRARADLDDHFSPVALGDFGNQIPPAAID